MTGDLLRIQVPQDNPTQRTTFGRVENFKDVRTGSKKVTVVVLTQQRPKRERSQGWLQKNCPSMCPKNDISLFWGFSDLASCSRKRISLSEWEKLAKAVCKLCRTTSHNDALVTTLKEDNVAEAQEEIAGLRNFHASFAKWRFGTVKAVLTSLRRCEKGLKQAWQRLPKKSQRHRPQSQGADGY